MSATLLFPTEEYYGVSAKTIASLPGEEEGFTNFNRILDLVGNTKEIDEDEFAELWANIPQIDWFNLLINISEFRLYLLSGAAHRLQPAQSPWSYFWQKRP